MGTIAPPRAVVDLAAVRAADVGTVGGKGANLGEMIQSGFPVPGGFVVTADAYLATIGEAGVRDQLAELERAHTVIVPGWRSPDAVPRPAFLKALQAAWKRGARIVSLCSGAFVLGHAGLLDGKRVTAHWMHADLLAQLFPKATVVRDQLYVHDGRILSSAGSSAGLDLCLSIIRKDFGVEVANTVAFLLSPRSAGINAQGLVIDAGMSCNYFDGGILAKATKVE